MLRTVARLDGTPFPATAAWPVAGRAGGCGDRRRWRRRTAPRWWPPRTRRWACSTVRRPTNYYDPGMFWCGDDLELLQGAELGEEIRVLVPRPAEPATPWTP